MGNILEENMDALSEKPVQIEFAKMKYGQLPRSCKSCEYLERCWGECPKNLFVPDNKSSYPKAYLCEGWTYFYKNTDDIFTRIAQSL